MSVISILVRTYFLPNPFAALENGDLYGWVSAFILLPITRGMVSFFYERGSAPTWGSFLFLLIYIVNTLILLLCGLFSFHIVACVFIGILYIVAFVYTARFVNDFSRGY
jgi:hypothetical protein